MANDKITISQILAIKGGTTEEFLNIFNIFKIFHIFFYVFFINIINFHFF